MRIFSFLASLIIMIVGLTLSPDTSSANSATLRLSSPLLLTTSAQATRIRTGMSFQDVVQILGRQPDTIINDEIRQEIGEDPLGVDFYSFQWKNEKSDCFPIVVNFSPISHTVSGLDEGRNCHEGIQEAGLADPIGRSCKNSSNCKF